ncbi:MAG: hypothetical protein CSA35_04395 [Dethiosulfovibrio peptidovorans]|nr:MAG: hypothetical protein CSA35_04395 [Dethiosulfovibrio peptidovorans]
MAIFTKKGSAASLLSALEKLLPLVGALIAGVTLGALAGALIQMLISPVLLQERIHRLAFIEAGNATAENQTTDRARELDLFLRADPFQVPRGEKISVASSDFPQEERVFSVDGIKVVGSLPGVAAWLDESSTVSLILLGQTYKGFLLKDILPYSVVLNKDNVNYEVYISYKDTGEKASSAITSEPKPSYTGVVASDPSSMVQAAGEDSEGVVARELVDSLLMNPFDELKKIRLIPKFVDGKPVGIEVANITDGSVLKELGVSKGDVVKSVNGVVIRNMGDVANAINSLMGGSRFEVSVGRGDREIMLNYVVK